VRLPYLAAGPRPLRWSSLGYDCARSGLAWFGRASVAEKCYGRFRRSENQFSVRCICLWTAKSLCPGGMWETPCMECVLPTIVSIAAANPAQTVLKRFITLVNWSERPGRWQRYFKRWECATLCKLPTSNLDIVLDLVRFAPLGVEDLSATVPESAEVRWRGPRPMDMPPNWRPCSSLKSLKAHVTMRCE
jgi:hypothetical protein